MKDKKSSKLAINGRPLTQNYARFLLEKNYVLNQM